MSKILTNNGLHIIILAKVFSFHTSQRTEAPGRGPEDHIGTYWTYSKMGVCDTNSEEPKK